MMPILFPGNVQEVIDLGRIGFELSRYSGLWVGFKMVTNVADEYSSTEVAPDRVTIHDPGFSYKNKPWQPNQNPNLLTPYTLSIEREIFEGRMEAARLFGVANQLNKVTLQTADDWIGIIAAGKTYYDLRQAFRELDLSDDDLQHYGIRLMKVSLLAPADAGVIRDFARGLEEIFVIEEKRAFMNCLFVMPSTIRQNAPGLSANEMNWIKRWSHSTANSIPMDWRVYWQSDLNGIFLPN
jgi:indolepyruvate ferredoxin oxidoreductase